MKDGFVEWYAMDGTVEKEISRKWSSIDISLQKKLIFRYVKENGRAVNRQDWMQFLQEELGLSKNPYFENLLAKFG